MTLIREGPIPMGAPHPHRPSVVIVGGGMGGIQAAKTLATAPVDITLVNLHNCYLFQPLIYEVANALLQAEDVAHSIRGMLRYLPNFRFRVTAASSVDWQRRELRLGDGDRIGFDYLILATGLETDFRGIPGAAEHALPLKSLDDAQKIRTQMLRRAETVAAHPALVPAGALDVVVVGGGTTGVETVGAFAEIYHHALPEEFADLDFSHAGITLLEAGDAILSAFHPRMQQAAQRMLKRRGVQVRLRAPVAQAAGVGHADGRRGNPGRNDRVGHRRPRHSPSGLPRAASGPGRAGPRAAQPQPPGPPRGVRDRRHGRAAPARRRAASGARAVRDPGRPARRA